MNSRYSSQLGTVIEEVERYRPSRPWELTVVAFVFAALIFVCAYFGLDEPLSLGGSVCLAAFVLAVSAILAGTHKLLGTTANPILRIHENGVSVVQSGTSTEIHYNDLHEYTCKKIGASSGERFELELKSRSFGDARTINWISDSHSEVDFDALHVRISKRVAENMAAMLESNQKIRWGDWVFICSDGIECRVKTGATSWESRVIPWSELRDMKFVDAELLLSFEPGYWNVKISCNEPNVLAGYLLVDRHMKALFGEWMESRQSNEEVAKAVVDRSVYHPIHF